MKMTGYEEVRVKRKKYQAVGCDIVPETYKCDHMWLGKPLKKFFPPAVIMKVKLVYFVKGADMKTGYTMISGAKIIWNNFENYFFQNFKIHKNV